MAFGEVRFPDMTSRGVRGRPQRRAQIVTMASGDEARSASWANSRRAHDAACGIRRTDDLAAVIAFFEARNGRLRGSRWKDWADYKSCLPSAAITAFDQPLGTGSRPPFLDLDALRAKGCGLLTKDIQHAGLTG